MRNYAISSLLLINLLISTGAVAANNFVISGTIPAKVQLHQKNNSYALTANNSYINISLEHVILSAQAKQQMAQNVQSLTSQVATINSNSPTSSYIGMGNVPVLNQGEHGACVTFAVTAALDAAYNNSDYISQVCNLELGTYLQNQNANYPSGWDGSVPDLVLNQIKTYGIITTQYQKEYGCGNAQTVLKAYPLSQYDTGVAMSIKDFTAHSIPIMQYVSYKVLLSDQDSYSKTANMNTVLQNVKSALQNGHRVTFGTALDVSDELEAFNGAMGNYNGFNNDAWVLTDKIIADIQHDAKYPNDKPQINAGHAMIIIGYDDNAIITDSNYKQHRGVLTLRNSWTAEAGDHGNYYMSYDFFKAMVSDAQEIISH